MSDTYVDSFETERWLASVNLAGKFEAGSARLMPGLELAITEDRQKAKIDALSNPVPEQTVGLSEVTARID